MGGREQVKKEWHMKLEIMPVEQKWKVLDKIYEEHTRYFQILQVFM